MTGAVFGIRRRPQSLPSVLGQQQSMFHVGQAAGEPTALLVLPFLVQGVHHRHTFVQVSTKKNSFYDIIIMFSYSQHFKNYQTCINVIKKSCLLIILVCLAFFISNLHQSYHNFRVHLLLFHCCYTFSFFKSKLVCKLS